MHDVDKAYHRYKNLDINISNDIGNRDYEMRDFDILDLNNFRITLDTSLEILSS